MAIDGRIKDCLVWSGSAVQIRTISLFGCLGPAYVYSHSHTAHTLKSVSVCVCVWVHVEVNRLSEDLCFSLDSLDLKSVS